MGDKTGKPILTLKSRFLDVVYSLMHTILGKGEWLATYRASQKYVENFRTSVTPVHHGPTCLTLSTKAYTQSNKLEPYNKCNGIKPMLHDPILSSVWLAIKLALYHSQVDQFDFSQ